MKQLNTIQKMEKLKWVICHWWGWRGGSHHLYQVCKLNTGRISDEDNTFRTRPENMHCQQSRCSVAQEKILTQSAVLLILTYWKLSETDFPLSSRVLIHLTKQLRRYTMLRDRLCCSIVELKICATRGVIRNWNKIVEFLVYSPSVCGHVAWLYCFS